MPGPETERKPWKIALAFLSLGLILGILALFFWPESLDPTRPEGLPMPGAGSSSSMAARAKKTTLFESHEGITPYSEAWTRDFFRKVAEALDPELASSERSRLMELLMADPEVRSRYQEYLKSGRIPNAEELAQALKDSGAAERLLAELRRLGPGAERMLVRADGRAAKPEPSPSPKPSASLKSLNASSSISPKLFNHIFSMVTPPQRQSILDRMESGRGVWDACSAAGLTADCNAAVQKCKADEGCLNWLQATGQKLPGEDALLTKTADRKSVARGKTADDKKKDEPDGPADTGGTTGDATGGSTGGTGGGGGDDGGDGGGGGSGGGGGTGTTAQTREEICAAKPWKSFCPGHEAYEDPPPTTTGSDPTTTTTTGGGSTGGSGGGGGGGDSGGGPQCFIAGTRVLTPNGAVPIEDIRVGDLVVAFDVDRRRPVEVPVEALIRGTATSFVRVRLKGGLALQVTPRHRFYDPAGRAWVAAENLLRGAPVYGVSPIPLAADSELPLENVAIEDVERLETRPRAVFNLTVAAPHHNYFAEGVLVHNRKRINEP
ncbi:MAG: Hint domain-containing protein [Elusimicrobia bacterium]|nr:Hint domain-containing protein [Elusimicrobiota bacterium]